MSGMSAPEAGAGCYCRRGRELCEALISLTGRGQLTSRWSGLCGHLAGSLFSGGRAAFQVLEVGGAVLPGTGGRVRRLRGALRCYRLCGGWRAWVRRE